MKKTLIKKALSFASILVGVFFITGSVKADSILDYTTTGSEVPVRIGSTNIDASGYVRYYGWLYQPGASHNICSVWVYQTHNNGAEINVSINAYPFGTTTSTLTTLFGTWQTLGNSSQTYNSTTTTFQLHEYAFNPCVTVIGGSLYSIAITSTPLITNGSASLQAGTGILTSGGTGIVNPFTQDYDASHFYKYVAGVGTGGGGKPLYLILNGTENFSAFQPPGATTTLSTLSSNCTDGNSITNSLCYMFQYLFIPDQSMLNEWVNFTEIIQSKIPFSYFYEIYDSVTGQSTTGTGTPITSLDLTASSTALHITYSPFSTSTLISLIGQPMYDFYQTLMRYGVLATFGFYVFNRVKSLMEGVK